MDEQRGGGESIIVIGEGLLRIVTEAADILDEFSQPVEHRGSRSRFRSCHGRTAARR
jgi:hypothetical protein